MDPMAEDYLNNLLDIAAKIQQALGRSSGAVSSRPA
jgi:hypothetical protein